MCRCEGRIPARVVLGMLVFLMFVLTQMIRSNPYLVIIEMTDDRNTSAGVNATSSTEKLSWTRQQAGVLMGAFFWCYWLTELPGGILATRFGGSRLLLFSVLAAALLNIAMPLASSTHFWAAVVVRLLQGLALGVSWPCVHALSARWIPLVERSKFTATYNGTAIGGALNSVLSGLLAAHLGWQHVFYLTGALSLLWCCAWAALIHDSPSQHPSLSSAERRYLQDTVAPTKGRPQKVPWSSILRSGPFWAVLLASQVVVWIVVTLAMQVPTYFSSVHGLGITANGLVSCLPEICRFIVGVAISAAVDSSVKRRKISITAARKLAVTSTTLLAGLLLVVLGYCAHNTALAVAVLILASSAAAATTSGNLPNTVDISPNYAGILLGLVKTVVVIPGALAPVAASYLVTDDDVAAGWRRLFYLTGALGAAGCLVFVLLGSGEVQPWNDIPQDAAKATEVEDLVQTKE